ncbi:fimbria/pilus outer membrane usher protein [Serratia fonticola]
MFLNRCPHCALAAAIIMATFNTSAKEGVYFNPAFLGDDPSLIADLSRFEKGAENLPGIYRVDVFVNRNASGTHELEFRALSEGGDLYPCLSRDMLVDFNVDLSVLPEIDAGETCLSIADIISDTEVTTALDKLRLDISIPQVALLPTFRGYIPPERWDNGITAVFLNYQYSGNNTLSGNSSQSHYANLQGGINLGPWRLRDYSTYSDYSGHREWNHISTVLQRTFPGITSVFSVGDTYSSGDVFDGVRLRGMKLETDNTMRPQALQGFAPVVRGIARTAAKVIIRQNGYEIYQTNVQSGAFELTDFYPAATSGDLEVSVEEESGRKEVFIVPYSTVPALQREGEKSYSLSLGRLEGGLSQRTQDVVQGELKWGLPAGVTLYGGLQASNSYRAYALGGGLNLGSFGAVSGDITQASTTLNDGSQHSGQSLRFLYAKSLNSFGTHFQLIGYRYSTVGFYSLNESTWEAIPGSLRYAKKGQAQASINQRIGDLGSLYVSASRQTYWGRDDVDQSVQLGLNGNTGKLSWGVAYSHSDSPVGGIDRSVALNFSLPLMSPDFQDRHSGRHMTANASLGTTFERDGTSRHRASVGGTFMEDSRLSYNLNQSYDTRGNGVGTDGFVGYRGRYGDARLGYSQTSSSRQLRTDLSGGLLVHADGLTVGPMLGETNILVDAGGTSGVAIEGVPGLKTDAFGHALVTGVSPYRENRVSLDTRSFSDDLEAEETVNNVVPSRGAIVKASFATRRGKKALINLSRDGQPLPFGTLVSLAEEESEKLSYGIVGDEGQVYMSGLPDSGSLVASWADGASGKCTASYSVPQGGQGLPQINAVCR